MSERRSLPDLSRFQGSSALYHHPLNLKVAYTEGVKHLVTEVPAFWLLDKIALSLLEQRFQVWHLKVEGGRAVLTCEDGNGYENHSEKIGATDFPEPGIDLWLVDGVICLPSEY